ncbi:MAG TPA: DUF4286 family protein [Dehalococcoidia bacterium]|nr:DUF4286 family protein [Dehalococcoidia bacterium]
MTEAMILNIVASDCPAELEDKFNRWYNEVHIPMLFLFKGLKKVTRYRLADESKDQAKYLALYQFESEKAITDFMTSQEFTAASEEMRETWKDGGLDIKWIAQYNPIKTWVK